MGQGFETGPGLLDILLLIPTLSFSSIKFSQPSPCGEIGANYRSNVPGFNRVVMPLVRTPITVARSEGSRINCRSRVE